MCKKVPPFKIDMSIDICEDRRTIAQRFYLMAVLGYFPTRFSQSTFLPDQLCQCGDRESGSSEAISTNQNISNGAHLERVSKFSTSTPFRPGNWSNPRKLELHELIDQQSILSHSSSSISSSLSFSTASLTPFKNASTASPPPSGTPPRRMYPPF